MEYTLAIRPVIITTSDVLHSGQAIAEVTLGITTEEYHGITVAILQAEVIEATIIAIEMTVTRECAMVSIMETMAEGKNTVTPTHGSAIQDLQVKVAPVQLLVQMD